MMRSMTMLLALIAISPQVWSQQIERSSHPQGVQIQGNTEFRAQQEQSTSVAAGEANVVKNTASAIKGGTQIQGNTKVQAVQNNAKATAVGKNNAAGNEVGVIGGK